VEKEISFDAIILHYIHRQESTAQRLMHERTEDRRKLLLSFPFFSFPVIDYIAPSI